MSRTVENYNIRLLKDFKRAIFLKKFDEAEVILDLAETAGFRNILSSIPLSTKNPEELTQFRLLSIVLEADVKLLERCLDEGFNPNASNGTISILDQAALYLKPGHYAALKEKNAHSLTEIYTFIDGLSDKPLEEIITSNASFADAIFACANSEMCSDKFEMVSRILDFGKGKYSIDVTSSTGLSIRALLSCPVEKYLRLVREFDASSKPVAEEDLVVDDSPATIAKEGPHSPDFASSALSVAGDSLPVTDDL